MSVLDELIKELDGVRVTDGLLARNARIVAGKVTISVQASEFHYCLPRKTIASMDGYQNVEVALFVNDRWAYPSDREATKPLAKYVDGAEGEETCVMAYVPLDVLASVVANLRGLHEA